MTTARKPAAEHQQEIVKTTLRLLSELGEGGLSTQTIADHIGITQTGLFGHFPPRMTPGLQFCRKLSDLPATPGNMRAGKAALQLSESTRFCWHNSNGSKIFRRSRHCCFQLDVSTPKKSSIRYMSVS